MKCKGCRESVDVTWCRYCMSCWFSDPDNADNGDAIEQLYLAFNYIAALKHEIHTAREIIAGDFSSGRGEGLQSDVWDLRVRHDKLEDQTEIDRDTIKHLGRLLNVSCTPDNCRCEMS